jgi:hypothetical protein
VSGGRTRSARDQRVARGLALAERVGMHATTYDRFALPHHLPEVHFGVYGVPMGALDWWWSAARDTA